VDHLAVAAPATHSILVRLKTIFRSPVILGAEKVFDLSSRPMPARSNLVRIISHSSRGAVLALEGIKVMGMTNDQEGAAEFVVLKASTSLLVIGPACAGDWCCHGTMNGGKHMSECSEGRLDFCLIILGQCVRHEEGRWRLLTDCLGSF